MNNFIISISDLRNALKGLSGSAEIKVKVPHKGKGNHMLTALRVTYDKNWKCYVLNCPEID